MCIRDSLYAYQKTQKQVYRKAANEYTEIVSQTEDVYKRQVLILDEPTSSLDPFAEFKLYNEVFEKKDPNQTVIIISHKLLTTQNADMIYYMENGRILENGKHKDLSLIHICKLWHRP